MIFGLSPSYTVILKLKQKKRVLSPKLFYPI